MATRRFRGGAGLPLAGGGGARKFSLIHQGSKIVTAAQLKDLVNTGVEIVAGIEGIVLIPVTCALVFNYIDPQYGNLTPESTDLDLALTIGGLGVTHWSSSRLAMPSNNRTTIMTPNDYEDDGGLPDSGNTNGDGLNLELWNWVGPNYTDGNGTLGVHVAYHKLNLESGLFI